MQEDIIKLNEYIEYIESKIVAAKDDEKIILIKTLATLLNAKIMASHKNSYQGASSTATSQTTGGQPAARGKSNKPMVTMAIAQTKVNTTCECGGGVYVMKQYNGNSFLGCSAYPACKKTISIRG